MAWCACEYVCVFKREKEWEREHLRILSDRIKPLTPALTLLHCPYPKSLHHTEMGVLVGMCVLFSEAASKF